jgi:hypothetical protein
MSDKEAKAIENLSLNSMPTLTETQSENELPVEVVLAILYAQAKRLEKEKLAQILTGRTPKGAEVTYIKLTGVAVDKVRGFVLALRESVGSDEK